MIARVIGHSISFGLLVWFAHLGFRWVLGFAVFQLGAAVGSAIREEL